MPIYEYVCRDCGHELEQLQQLSDNPLTECPACGEAALKRKMSAAGFRLSGGGWYETDFKRDKRRNLSASDTQNESADKASDDKTDKTEKAAKTEKSTGDSSAPANKESGSAPAKKSDSGSASKKDQSGSTT